MKIIRTVSELCDYSAELRKNGKTIGLVPTMGALHAGHLSLVKHSTADNDATIVSVFVNPTQFNNPRDLATYPRDEKADFSLLESAGADAVFAPTPEEVYPDGTSAEKVYDLGTPAEVMEGKFRPGHFQGVAQIVSRLFRFANPHRAYFGEKDFQQIAVIRYMARTEGFDLDIVSCPIVRQSDGLALSSRNALLSPEAREVAPEIFKTLIYAVEYSKTHSVAATHDTVVERIDALPHCRVEYFEIVDASSLLPVKDWDDAADIQGCITVYCGDVRLIDNIAFRRQKI